MPPELPATLADVRSNGSATDWCLCGFEGAALQLQPYVLEAATLGAGGCNPMDVLEAVTRRAQPATPRAPGAAVRLIGSGSGGVAELASHLSQDNLFYGFVRTTEAIDR